MWEGVQDRATEAVFRMEEMGDEESQAALWAGARATHAGGDLGVAGPQAQTDAAQKQTTTRAARGRRPSRSATSAQKVGRNDPCPCGSGKKYKNCHMKMEMKK